MSDAVILLAGPTASGKSALALAIAEEFGGIVVNADSMQVYRELRVLTARPTPEEEARVPHRLYGVLSAAEACSAGRWRDMALAAIAAAHRAGQVPIVVGGTGLYFRVLTEGLAPVPPVPEAVRAAARAAFARLGEDRFRAALAARDPVMAARLKPGDRQRLIRAYEVIEATGTSLADWQSLPPEGPGLAGPAFTLVMEPERQILYARCDARLDRMIAEGALDEVRGLMDLGLDPDLPAMKALGVPDLGRHLAGEIDLETAVSRAKTQTRRYAKRQGTWFRNQIRDGFVVSAQDLESLKKEIFPKICEFLLTGYP
ncbi:MAG: tRNA (adenosine(37)-N6)-dimethylallyltransferase MiaA [Minwuiales bacterium]|nr:tRNA (adenosine(37)-N6)-dimethylallyltransferase MiaA [Minwuiales bacterium]